MATLKRVMVCVTQQKTCERLIKKAKDIIVDKDASLFVIHVVKNNWKFLNNAHEGEALEYLFTISKAVGADLTVLRSDSISETLVDFAKEHKIDSIVMGSPSEDYSESKFYTRLKTNLPHTEIIVFPQSEIS